MLGRLGAALAAAAVLAAAASADDPPRPAEPAQPDVTLFESSARLRLNWSEIAFRGNRPKAWDHVVSPEVRANIRVLAGLFEGKAEIGFAADHFAPVGGCFVGETRQPGTQLGDICGQAPHKIDVQDSKQQVFAAIWAR